MHYYDFLHLCGYKKCHEYHYLEENQGYRKLHHYYVEHYNKLIGLDDIKRPNIIPNSWYRHKREDVDYQLKCQSIETGMEIWINWEKQTKQFYQKKFKQLIQLGEIAAAIFLQQYVCDVSDELRRAENELLDLKAINYDMVSIIEKQQKNHKKYKKKIVGDK